MDLPYITDSNRIVNSTPKYEGFFGKWIKRPWNGIKSGFGKAGKWIGDSKVGKAGKWAWKNKVPIMSTVGGAMQGLGIATGNPAMAGIGSGLSLLSNGIQEGEAKKALEQAIAERQPNPFGNNNIAYTDMPRIHYSRKPAAMKIYQNPNAQALLQEGGPETPSQKKYVDEVERKEAQMKQQKKYRIKKKLKKLKKRVKK